MAACNPVNGTNVVLAPYVSGLDLPLMITAPPNDRRNFVIEQDGRIEVITDGVQGTAPFIDLTTLVLSGGERGLLGLAFHPNFGANQLFYVHFTRRPDGDHVIAEFRATAGTDTADIGTRRDLLVFDDPYSNHNGGSIEFGNDRMLYIAIGDGGNGGDPQDRAQNDTVLFGKLLRIDVDSRTGTKQYGIPSDNPFASSPDGPGDPRPEVWHKGLRNPFRFSFDRANGNVYIGDVGQGAWEEIDVAANTAGINWGWDDREGAHCYEPTTNCLTAMRREPVAEHSAGSGWHAIIGGQVYRGSCFPDLVGTYFYGDYSAQQLWAFEYDGTAAVNRRQVLANVGDITAIHADAFGELYVVTHNGTIRRITAN
jgi:glucose/arabinose dehydrogenase